MRASRAFASILGLASIGFVLFAFTQQAIDFRSLLLVALGALILFAAVFSAWRASARTRWLFVSLSGLYSTLVLGALVLQIDQERMMAIRAGLSGLLLAGLLLTLWCTYGTRPPNKRRSLHNYYD